MPLAAALSALLLFGQSADPEATRVDDVEVLGRPTPEAVRDFVGRIAAPSTGRSLARWHGDVCPGVVNLRADVAQPILDRIADVATELGIETGAPGCKANLVILFTDDGAGMAREMVAQDRSLFRIGVGGLDRGSAALTEFQTADRPVRWWPLSVPIDSRTGQRAVRVPGDRTGMLIDDYTAMALCGGECGGHDSVLGAAPMVVVDSGSRLNTQIEEHLYKTIIIVDIDAIGAVSAGQLGDYLAMVGLAQIDAGADTSGFDTVLNLFDDPQAVAGLSDWDRSYLKVLYGSRSMRRSPGVQATALANLMTRDRVASAIP